MKTQQQDFEVVRVIKPSRLVDADSYERVYRRRDGQALAVGYYVVSWPPHMRAGVYNEDAAFRGPYRDRETARDALRQFQTWATLSTRAPVARAAPKSTLGSRLDEAPSSIPERWRVVP